VGVDVAGRDAGHPERGGEIAEAAVAGTIAAPERELELDPEAVRPERGEERPAEPLGAAMVAADDPPRQGAVAGAAGEADDAAPVALDVGSGCASSRVCAWAIVSSRQRFR
jgi:hypothetical protein